MCYVNMLLRARARAYLLNECGREVSRLRAERAAARRENKLAEMLDSRFAVAIMLHVPVRLISASSDSVIVIIRRKKVYDFVASAFS